MLSLALFWLATTLEAQAGHSSCSTPEASAALSAGKTAVAERRYPDAKAAYAQCLAAEPGCTACTWERGWLSWALTDYAAASADFGAVLAAEPGDAEVQRWAEEARHRATAHPPLAAGYHVPIGTTSTGAGRVTLTMVARFQNYSRTPRDAADHYDPDIVSPKSVRFLEDGSKVYVNSLAGKRTVVYDPRTLTRLTTIRHTFGAEQSALFYGLQTVFDYPYLDRAPSGDVNRFSGLPVESALSHGGRYLWIPYYRRDFDRNANSPSAVSVVDTRTDQIVRIFPSGPLPKYVAASPDGKMIAVIHWGDNTAGIIDIQGDDPAAWVWRPQRLVVDYALNMRTLSGRNRDDDCGLCLRGSVFTPDSRTLLIARMGGGISGFDVETMRMLGTVTGERESPRHLVLSPDGQWLYASLNNSGYVGRIPLSSVMAGLQRAGGKKVRLEDWEQVHVGAQARTLDITSDGRLLFVALQASAEVVVVDARTLKIEARARTDAWAVGLALAPDDRSVWLTSQGDDRIGGNSVTVFRIDRTDERVAR